MAEIYAFGGYLQEHIGDGTNTGTVTESISLPRKIILDEEFERGSFPLCIAISWSDLIFTRGNQMRLCGHGGEHGGAHRKVTLDKIIQHVSASWNEHYVTYQDGTCHVWADISAQTTPKVVCSKSGLRSVSAGEVYTCGITIDNEAGLVERTEVDAVLYRPLVGNMNIKSVSCGKEHVLLMTGIGSVLSFGLGSRGQLGHGTTVKLETAAVVEAVEGMRMVGVCAGGWHSAAVSDIGDVYVWGWNESGQLGLPSKAVGDQLGAEPRSCRCNTSEPAPSGPGTAESINILCLPHVVDFVTQTRHVDGGESHEEREVNVISVSCGSRHTVAVTDDGSLYSWGWNDHGQLGHGDTLSRDSPCVVSFFDDRKLKVREATAGSWSTVVLADVL